MKLSELGPLQTVGLGQLRNTMTTGQNLAPSGTSANTSAPTQTAGATQAKIDARRLGPTMLIADVKAAAPRLISLTPSTTISTARAAALAPEPLTFGSGTGPTARANLPLACAAGTHPDAAGKKCLPNTPPPALTEPPPVVTPPPPAEADPFVPPRRLPVPPPAAQQPPPPDASGGCPSGFFASGGECYRDGTDISARQPPPNGGCPTGTKPNAAGTACEPVPTVYDGSGSCPEGYVSSAAGCVKQGSKTPTDGGAGKYEGTGGGGGGSSTGGGGGGGGGGYAPPSDFVPGSGGGGGVVTAEVGPGVMTPAERRWGNSTPDGKLLYILLALGAVGGGYYIYSNSKKSTQSGART